MNKKGLTIVELLAVLVVIGLISLIIFPIITDNINDSKNEIREMQESSIKEAATKYVADNIGLKVFLGETTKETITLQSLIDNGYIKGEFEDPITGKQYDLTNSKVTITKSNTNYQYEIELISE